MTTTDTPTSATRGPISAGSVDLWIDQRGNGPDVLLIAGLSDPTEAWEPQLQGLSDRYRLTAFDNRSAARSPLIPEGFTAADMADDAAELLRTLGIRSTTSPASPEVPSPPRNWRSATPTSCGASCSSARGASRRVLSRDDRRLAVADRGGPERPRGARGVLRLGLHAAGARRRHGRPDHPRGAGLPPPTVARGVPATARRVGVLWATGPSPTASLLAQLRGLLASCW